MKTIKRHRSGTTVKIGSVSFTSIKAAERELKLGRGYIAYRMNSHNSTMPNGDKIKIVTTEIEPMVSLTIKVTEADKLFIEEAAGKLGISQGWLFEKICKIAKPLIEQEIKKSENKAKVK